MGAAVNNSLYVEVFSSGTTRIDDPRNELSLIENIRFSTGYPGGLYLSASMFVPRDVIRHWFIQGAQRLVIRNGRTTVFEGKIGDLDRALQRSSEGIKIKAQGYWGALLGSRRLRRLYADNRTSEDAWLNATETDFHAEQTSYSRYDEGNSKNMLRMVPHSGVDWANLDRTRLRYEAPTGETIRRMDFDYDFSEGAQQWKAKIRDITNTTDLLTLTATGSMTGQNVAPASGCQEGDGRREPASST